MNHRDQIERYAKGGPILAKAVDGLTEAELNAFPIPGTWSIKQIAVHLLESELAAVHRMRRIVAEEKPLFIAYDETLLSKSLGYEKADLALVTRLFQDCRTFTSSWLRTVPDEAFARAGVHNHYGLVTLERMVGMYADHLDGHMVHLRKKRELLGKPLAGI